MSFLVIGDVAPPGSAELDAIRSASMRLRSGKLTDAAEIERILEVGFAVMLGLEAELSRLRARATLGEDPERATEAQSASPR
jgi:hypothetical protein